VWQKILTDQMSYTNLIDHYQMLQRLQRPLQYVSLFIFLNLILLSHSLGQKKADLKKRGQVGRLNYRLVISDPFPITSGGTSLPALSTAEYPITSNSNFAQRGNHDQFRGYLFGTFLTRNHIRHSLCPAPIMERKMF